MKEDARPSKQRPYTYNDNFAKRIKEEIIRGSMGFGRALYLGSILKG